MARLFNELGEVVPAQPATPPTWMQALPSIATALVQAKNQDRLMKLNLQRESQGLAPIDGEAYAPGVKVGLDPQTRKLIFAGIAVAVLGYVLVGSINRRKGKN